MPFGYNEVSGKRMNDIRFAIRQLRKSPVFMCTVVLTLALGIGANTAIFTLVHAVLLKSLPVADPKSLWRIGDTDNCCVNGGFVSRSGDFDIFSYDLYRQFQQAAPEFEQLAAMQSGSNRMNVRRGSEQAKAQIAEYVSGNYFGTFGLGAIAGRPLTDADDKPGAPPAAVMSFEIWQTDYASDPSIVGSTFYVQNHPVTIVGVAPPGFFGDRLSSYPPALWLPLALEPAIEQDNSILRIPEANWLYVVGRLKPNTAIAPLQAKISMRLRNWLATQPAYTKNGGASIIHQQHVVLSPAGAGIQNLQQERGKGLYLLMALSGFVLLVACANVANLLLARGAARANEMSLRVAIGAGRRRLIQQMLTESVLLACLGGVAGLAVAYAGTRTILALAFPNVRHLSISPDPSLTVIGFAFLISLLTGIIFGIVPAWSISGSDPAQALRGANRTTGDHSSIQQKLLIVFQGALSLVLLVGAGLLTASLRNLEHQNFGIQTDNRLVFHLDPAGAGYTAAKLPALYQAMETQLSAIPGVQSVGLGLYGPLEGNNWGESIRVQGRPEPPPNFDSGASWDRVNPDFFQTVGQRVLRGRGITDRDTASSAAIAVVNQAFVRKFFPHEDPIGRHFGIFDMRYAGAFEIVGVVADAKYTDPREEVRPMYFRPLTQTLKGLTEPNFLSAETRSLYVNSVTLQFKGKPANAEANVRRTLAHLDRNLTIIDFRSMPEQVADNFIQERLVARLTMLFGIVALLLASVGLYGVTAYQVERRTNEIGLRMALGADRSKVVGMVLRSAFVQLGIGMIIGIPIAIGSAAALSDQLYKVPSYDPASLFGAALVLAFAATIAALVPATRAASVDPLRALRAD